MTPSSSAPRAPSFSPVAMIVLLLVGVVAMTGLGVLSAYAPELKPGDDGGGHALSKSATGFGGVARLLRLSGVPVVLSRTPVGDAGADSLLVLTPDTSTSRRAIADQRHAGPMLIVLPKWRAAPHHQRQGWVSTVGLEAPGAVVGVLPNDLRTGTILHRREKAGVARLSRPNGRAVGAPVTIDGLQTLSGPHWTPVVIDQAGAAVVAVRKGGWTYVLADPDFISTHGLKTLDGAQTASALLGLMRTADAPVVFDLTLHGFQRTRSLLRLMLEPPLLGLTLVLAALAALVGVQAAIRFGPATEPARAVALGKAALADNTAGLVRLARREHRMAGPYALLIRAAAARAIGAPRALSEAELTAFLDRVGANVGASETFSALSRRATAAATPRDLMQVARDLYRWNQELTRGHQ